MTRVWVEITHKNIASRGSFRVCSAPNLCKPKGGCNNKEAKAYIYSVMWQQWWVSCLLHGMTLLNPSMIPYLWEWDNKTQLWHFGFSATSKWSVAPILVLVKTLIAVIPKGINQSILFTKLKPKALLSPIPKHQRSTICTPFTMYRLIAWKEKCFSSDSHLRKTFGANFCTWFSQAGFIATALGCFFPTEWLLTLQIISKCLTPSDHYVPRGLKPRTECELVKAATKVFILAALSLKLTTIANLWELGSI